MCDPWIHFFLKDSELRIVCWNRQTNDFCYLSLKDHVWNFSIFWWGWFAFKGQNHHYSNFGSKFWLNVVMFWKVQFSPVYVVHNLVIVFKIILSCFGYFSFSYLHVCAKVDRLKDDFFSPKNNLRSKNLHLEHRQSGQVSGMPVNYNTNLAICLPIFLSNPSGRVAWLCRGRVSHNNGGPATILDHGSTRRGLFACTLPGRKFA